MTINPNIQQVIDLIKARRIESGITTREIEDKLNLGIGWIDSFENGLIDPPFDLVLAITQTLRIDLSKIMANIAFDEGQLINRIVSPIQDSDNLVLQFQYNAYKASYIIPDATVEEYNNLLSEFQSDLVVSKKNAVINLFFSILNKWPNVNPSDIWYFFISRLYQDPYNHPATEINRDFGQSWKRTSGWALEQIFINFYREELAKYDIEIDVDNSTKADLLDAMGLNYHVEKNKADILLVNTKNGAFNCFGVAHVKASIAERRQNDQNFSMALQSKNYFSPFLTMDCKAFPSANPVNNGEFAKGFDGIRDLRNDKRKEFEEEGYFTGCFSYNANTIPTAKGQKATSRIYAMNFIDPDDIFVKMAVEKRDQLYR